jgi:hypothetical protein
VTTEHHLVTLEGVYWYLNVIARAAMSDPRVMMTT